MNKLFKLFGLSILFTAVIFTACDNKVEDEYVFRIRYISGEDVTYTVLKKDAGFQYHYGNYFNNGIPNVDFAIQMTDGKDTYEIYLEAFVPKGQKRITAGEYEFAKDSSEYAELTFTFDSDFNVKRPEEGEEEDGEEILYKLSGGLITVEISGEGDNAVYTIHIAANITEWDEEEEKPGDLLGYIEGTYIGSLVWSDREVTAEEGEE